MEIRMAVEKRFGEFCFGSGFYIFLNRHICLFPLGKTT